MPTENLLTPTYQHCLARALYDNSAESPDELAFQKGDVLVVLEQNTSNLEGWWLCSLRGRQGICPGNRLRIIPGVYDNFLTPNVDVNLLQKQGKRRSWHVQPNKVLTPKKYNDVYLYDMPPPRCSPLPISPSISPRDGNNDCYDVPPKAIPLESRNCLQCSPLATCTSPIIRECESYDIPRPLLNQNNLTPSSSASSLTADSIGSSNRSSLANMPDYDIPRSHNKCVQLTIINQPQDALHQIHFKELPLEINSALDTLEQLQTETTSAISKLLSFVCSQWREKSKLEENIMEIKLAIIRLKTAIHDFAEFCEGALGNATKASDKNLANKLLPLVSSLRSSDKLVTDATEKLQQQGWNLHLLCRHTDEDKSYISDELEQIISCSKHLIEDVKETASFIYGNSTLLFKKDLSLSNTKGQWMEDYDYVRLDAKDVDKKHVEIRDAFSSEIKKSFDLVEPMNEMTLQNKVLNSDEEQVLAFFANQAIGYHQNLTQAIDVFLQTVEHNQPPKIFLGHGKFVVLSAHKLIHIGDTVHRNVNQPDIKVRALNCSNALSKTLEAAVTKIKQAALHFPSVTAVQAMVDSIVDISHLAKDVKLCIIQAVPSA